MVLNSIDEFSFEVESFFSGYQKTFGLWFFILIFCFACFSSADNSVRMFDRRKLNSSGVGSPIFKFEGHEAPVLCVQVNGRFCIAFN